MSRPLRIEYAGALYHITSRGDRREAIYCDDVDRQKWLEILAQVCSRFNWRSHAWCQMDNHYHLIIETAEANLSQGMRQLNGVYTQYYNRRHNLSGHVYQGRFKSILVDKSTYLLELSRYVVLNPLRATMINNIQDWQWSSYLAMIGEQAPPEWLEVDWLLSQFGNKRQLAIGHYKDFVRAGIGLPSLWLNLQNQMFLGEDEFIANIQKKAGIIANDSLKEVSRLHRRALAKPFQYYVDRETTRQKAMAKAYLSGNYAMKDIADWFGVHYSTVSRAVRQSELG